MMLITVRRKDNCDCYPCSQVDISSPVAYVMSIREDQELTHVKVLFTARTNVLYINR